jgi:hypothetical protein
VGADSAAYAVWPEGAGFQAENPSQGLHVRFGSAGVLIRSGSTRVGLSLRAVGYGASLHPVDVVVPTARVNRVSYNRLGLSEWYRNGPFGIEQGFTIARAPSSGNTRVLTLSIALSGNAQAALVADRQRLILTHPGGAPLRYSGLLATDARNRKLHSWLELARGRVHLRVDASGARYPLRIDPLVEQAELTGGAEEVGNAEFGAAVALSGDGKTAVIGGPADNKGAGAAWVFIRTGSTWTQQGAKLVGSGEVAEARFGGSVALSADGNTALIGGYGDNGGVGAAWVFTRSGSTWKQLGAKLTGAGEVGKGAFGSSVALSSDHSTALIGGPSDAESAGAMWTFKYESATSNYVEQGSKLTPAVKGKSFGTGVAVSATGETALVGGEAVRVFKFEGGRWTEQANLNESAEAVAMSNDGKTALIGEKNEAVVYTLNGSRWERQAVLGGSSVGERPGGHSVALAASGNIALTGGAEFQEYLHEEECFKQLVYYDWEVFEPEATEFKRSGSTWGQVDSFPPQALPRSTEERCYVEEGPPPAPEGQVTEQWNVALPETGGFALIGNSGLDRAFVFTYRPIVATSAASAIRSTSAVLHAEVDPNGKLVSACSFEYGTTTAYGSTASCSPAPGSGEASVAVAAAVKALKPNTTYHYRVVGTNEEGTGRSADATFTTYPVAMTGGASEVASASAMLHATIHPPDEGLTGCSFEYGTTTTYGASQKCATLPSGEEASAPVSAAITGLKTNSLYHFRAVTSSAIGTSYGEDSSFHTLLNSASATSTSSSTPASATDGPLHAVASGGTGTVTVGQYAADPISGPEFSNGQYSDVFLSAGNSFTKLEFVDCDLASGNKMFWWSGSWRIVSTETAPAGSPPCITVTINPTTNPNLSQMNGTVFGVFPVGAVASITKHLLPPKGRQQGGTSVAIAGTNFVDVLSVQFGSTGAGFTVSSPTSITAISPSHAIGKVDVTVTTVSGTSAISKFDRFKYGKR